MPGSYKADHICLQVADLDEAEAFYREAIGFTTIEHADDRVYLGCGFDANVDLALQEGPPGVEHVAVRVEDETLLDTYEHRLSEQNIAVIRTDGDEPTQESGIRFDLPSGLSMELVTVMDKGYKHYYKTAVPGRGGLAPLDFSHHNFHSPIVEEDSLFLREHLDFKVSAVINDWQDGAFLRRGDMHHDIAIFNHDGGPKDHASHHHAGFIVSSVDHMVKLLDRINDFGVDIEFGIGRHFGGDNVFAYFKAPDTHRIELVCQMTSLDDDTPVEFVEDVGRAVSAWHGENLTIPDSWVTTSGLVE